MPKNQNTAGKQARTREKHTAALRGQPSTGIDRDDELRPLFGRDVAGGKPRQKIFFAEWLGGPPSLQRGGLDEPDAQP